ncbi:putative cytochrome P450 [Hypoxylon argillaceum]|nr:putative cytochrome P450 [Hypoxylon argillaceum]
MIILLFLSSVLASLIWTLVCLELNVRKALTLGIPVVRIPVSAESNLWVIIQPLVWKILDSCVAIPWCSYPDFVRFSHRNWHFLEKSRPTERFGSAWALASPSGISLHVADPDAIVEIYSRWKDFVRPAHKYGMLAFYGPSVFTVGLDDWPRHRKAVAAPFSETLMNMVWNETLRLTEGMLQDWTTKFEAGILNLEESLRALTFNVLAATAFQESLTSENDSRRPKGAETRTETYRDTLRVVLDNAILLMLIPYRHLNGTLIPQGLSRIGRAAESFKLILLGMVREEEAAINRDSAASGGLLTPLVRAVGLQKALSEQSDTNEKVVVRAKRGTLSAAEILGNIFAINFAGHDTVLIALTFTLMLLAANTDVQEWLNEEITAVLGEDSSSKQCDWGYDQFPKLVRCRAVFFETLRLYAPITGVPKMATERAASLQVGGRLIPITPGIEVFPVLLGIQTDARYWGETSYEWRPMRWVLRPGTIGQEELLTPRKGTFFPWSDGPQNCVGRKFSIVEGVAVLARLFHQHRLRLKVDQNEREEGARKKALDCVDDVNYNLLLRMNNPEKVDLCVEAR